MSDNKPSLKSGIRDNLLRGTVHDFLEREIQSGSALSIVSAYFTIYAYQKNATPSQRNRGTPLSFWRPRFCQTDGSE